MSGERTESQNVSLYARDWEVVNEVAERIGGGNRSAAIRYIIRERETLQREVARLRQRVAVLQLTTSLQTDAGYLPASDAPADGDLNLEPKQEAE
jgi:hypothetical protein